jgi:signal transduction histidine kinase/ActR/RegA family two-component response regulator
MSHELSVDASRLPAALVRWFSELTHEGMFATDRELRVIVWNRWMEVHTERPASSVLGKPLFELYPGLVARGVEQSYREALAGRIAVMSFGLHRYILPVPPTHADLGFDEMPQSGRIGPLSDGDEVIGTVTTLEDISERLAREAELRKRIEVQQLARLTAEKALRAKDEFLSTVSHEMRNPLNAVLGWTRILIDRKEIDPELLERALRVIDRNAASQVRMIDDLLDVARIASGKLRLEMQPVDLLAVVLAAIDVVAPSARAKQVEIRTGLDAQCPRILGDQQRLQQIVWNLLSNAVKFTEPGGQVEVRVTHAGRILRLVVADTGHGISPEFLPFVFERFRQSDSSSTRRHGGLGLGLALVRELVELHGGQVTVSSEGERRGATFTVDLPTAMSPDVRFSVAPPQPESVHGAPSLAGLRVLIVEDEDDSRELLSAVLSRCGAETLTASSCLDAMAAIGNETELPDVIVSDLGMAGQDGYDLIRLVRALPPDKGGRIPAVAGTGYANPGDRQRVLAAGYSSHVAKPIDPRTVAVAVARAAKRDNGGKSAGTGPGAR